MPQSTIFCEHPVVIIDHGMTATKYALVELFARSLWDEPAQRIWVKYNFRSVVNEEWNRDQPKFARIELPFTVREVWKNGWEQAYKEVIEDVWKQQIQVGKK